jgi:hypothetical protein
MMVRRGSAIFLGLLLVAACRDVSEFTTRPGERFEGTVVGGSFVRSGVGAGVALCLSLDTSRLQSAPGAITSSDGRFRETPLRPIPQLWHDPLSTLGFGDGRLQNLVYVATAAEEGGPADVTVVVSLMQSGAVEVRILRSAPAVADAAAPPGAPPLFAVFNLERREGTCER